MTHTRALSVIGPRSRMAFTELFQPGSLYREAHLRLCAACTSNVSAEVSRELENPLDTQGPAWPQFTDWVFDWATPGPSSIDLFTPPAEG